MAHRKFAPFIQNNTHIPWLNWETQWRKQRTNDKRQTKKSTDINQWTMCQWTVFMVPSQWAQCTTLTETSDWHKLTDTRPTNTSRKTKENINETTIEPLYQDHNFLLSIYISNDFLLTVSGVCYMCSFRSYTFWTFHDRICTCFQTTKYSLRLLLVCVYSINVLALHLALYSFHIDCLMDVIPI